MHHTPHHHARSGLAAHLRASKMAMAQAQKIAQQSGARARGNMLRFQRWHMARRRRAANIEREVARLQSELAGLLSVPLECSPHRYEKGAALFIASNWTGRDGAARVVLACNTLLPNSDRPVAALLWHENEIEQVDFAEEPFEKAIQRGRLFVFTSSADFADGTSYAILPATFQETAEGGAGFWSFATAGSFKSRPFILGRGAAGTFVDRAGHHVMVARPVHFDTASRTWIWMGRSSDRTQGRVRLHVDVPFDSQSQSKVFELPASPKRPDVAIFACAATDDRGDPLGLVNTHAPQQFGLTRINGTLHFFARPNQRDQQGRLVFATPAEPNEAGEAVLVVPLHEDGAETDVELPANHVLANGSKWFVRYPNTKDRDSGLPLVLIPLQRA